MSSKSVTKGNCTVTLISSKNSSTSVTVTVYIGFNADTYTAIGAATCYIGTNHGSIRQPTQAQSYSRGTYFSLGSYTHSVSGEKVATRAVVTVGNIKITVSDTVGLISTSTYTPTRATFKMLNSSYELNAYPHVSITSGSYNSGCTYKFVCLYSYGGHKTTTTFTSVSGGNYSDKTLDAVPWQNYSGTSNTTCTVTLYTYKSNGTQVGSSYSQTFTVLAPTKATIVYDNTSNTYNIGDRIGLTIKPGRSKRPVYYIITYGSGANSWSETVYDSSDFNKTNSIKIPQTAIKNKTSNPSYAITITTMNGSTKIGSYTTASKFTVKLPPRNGYIVLDNKDWYTSNNYNITLKSLSSYYTYKLEYQYQNENYVTLKNNVSSSTSVIKFKPTKAGKIKFRLSIINGTEIFSSPRPISPEKTINLSNTDEEKYRISSIKLDLVKNTNDDPIGEPYYIGISSMYLKIKISKGTNATISKVTCTSSNTSKVTFDTILNTNTVQYIKLNIKSSGANGVTLTVVATAGGGYGSQKNTISIPSSSDLLIKSYQQVKVTNISHTEGGRISFTLTGTAGEQIQYSCSSNYFSGSIAAKNFDGSETISTTIKSYDPSKKYIIKITAKQTLNGKGYPYTSDEYIIEGGLRPFNINFSKKMITIGGLAQRRSSNGWSFEIIGDLYINNKKVIVDSNGFLKVK